MTVSEKPWFTTSRPGSTCLRCCACGNAIDLCFPSLDHHPAACPVCGVESVFLSWRGVLLQIVPGQAPPELAEAIRWAQANLDEVEFLTLLSSLAELAQAIRGEPALTHEP